MDNTPAKRRSRKYRKTGRGRPVYMIDNGRDVPHDPALTDGERRLITLLRKGRTEEEICKELGLASKAALRKRIRRMLQKHDANNLLHLVSKVAANGDLARDFDFTP